MPDLVIKEAELAQLDKLIAPIPTQYGLPLVNFFNQIGQLRQREATQELPKKEVLASEKKEAPSPNGKKADKKA